MVELPLLAFVFASMPRNARPVLATGGTQARRPLPLLIGFWGCIVIAAAVVVRRLVALAHPVSSSAPPPLAKLDSAFASHAPLTLLHIIPALAFVLVTPLVIFRKPAGARWPERLFYPLGAAVGITAYAMSRYAVGGWTERSAVLLYNSLFLFCLWQSFRTRLREWVLRAVAILLGIATTRPVMGIFFATSRLTHLQPEQFFGIAFWIGFSINALVVELWIRKRRSNARALLAHSAVTTRSD